MIRGFKASVLNLKTWNERYSVAAAFGVLKEHSKDYMVSNRLCLPMLEAMIPIHDTNLYVLAQPVMLKSLKSSLTPI
jgi:hypothetical protein